MSRENEVLNFLEQEKLARQKVDGNYRLYLAEISWAQTCELLSNGHREAALDWAEHGTRVCGDDPWYEPMELNLRAWMIQQLGHQDDHPVLDTRVVVERFFGTLIWTPEEVVVMSHGAWRERDNEMLI